MKKLILFIVLMSAAACAHEDVKPAVGVIHPPTEGLIKKLKIDSVVRVYKVKPL